MIQRVRVANLSNVAWPDRNMRKVMPHHLSIERQLQKRLCVRRVVVQSAQRFRSGEWTSAILETVVVATFDFDERERHAPAARIGVSAQQIDRRREREI